MKTYHRHHRCRHGYRGLPPPTKRRFPERSGCAGRQHQINSRRCC